MANESDYTDAVGRQLLAVASALGNEAGWAAFDRSDQRLAPYLYGEAQLLAASSGTELRTLLWVNRSMQHTHLAKVENDQGHAREALRLAKLAADIAKHEPSPRLHTLIALRKATAHAQLGDARAFRTAITQARRELDRGPHPADPPWCGFVTEPEIAGHEAAGQLRLGFTKRSIKLYESVLDGVQLAPRNRTCWEASRAGALLDAGDKRRRSLRAALSCPCWRPAR